MNALNIICRDYSARLLPVENDELAIHLYATAERPLRIVTRDFTRALNFIVDGMFSGESHASARISLRQSSLHSCRLDSCSG